jgi:hypothetical protein
MSGNARRRPRQTGGGQKQVPWLDRKQADARVELEPPNIKTNSLQRVFAKTYTNSKHTVMTQRRNAKTSHNEGGYTACLGGHRRDAAPNPRRAAAIYLKARYETTRWNASMTQLWRPKCEREHRQAATVLVLTLESGLRRCDHARSAGTISGRLIYDAVLTPNSDTFDYPFIQTLDMIYRRSPIP